MKKLKNGRAISLILGVAIVIASFVIGFHLMMGGDAPDAAEGGVPSPYEREHGLDDSGKAGGKGGEKTTGTAVYEELQAAEDKGFLLLVNKNNPVLENYVPSDLEPIKYYAEDRPAGARFMKKEAADQFHRMVEAAAAEGITLVMTTAYRDYSFQTTLYNNYVASYGVESASMFSAKPGQSEHQTGLAVDITSPSVDFALSYDFGETAEGKWLAENCKDYGFILRYMDGKSDITGYNFEPWHFRYTGEAASKIIYEQNLTLEEFLKNMKDKTLF